jgi:hypothetical protein
MDDDDLTEQALDYFMKNDTLQKKLVNPIKRKILPYVLCLAFFNMVLFIMVAYLAVRLSAIM